MKYLTIIVVMFILTLLLIAIAESHDERGFTHVIETTGPCIKTFPNCDYETHLRGIDNNSDGKIDECKELILIHGILHERVSIPISYNECECKSWWPPGLRRK